MGYNVKVYIYDISQGMARTMGPALLGRPLEAIWHTAIVVYNKEYFFGGDGINQCHPGGTMLGQPMKIEELGETQITEDIFKDYLQNQSRDRFKGDKYNLLEHNCNNFSDETAKFLVGKGIPQHILDLPREVLSTPMGQMLMPMLQQMSGPGGSSMSFPENTGPPSSAQNFNQSTGDTSKAKDSIMDLPMTNRISFDQPLKVEGLTKKLVEFNSSQTEQDLKLTETELKVVVGIAKGLVRLSDDNFIVLTSKLSKWEDAKVFPLLDILREKSGKSSSFESEKQLEQVLCIFSKHLKNSSEVNSMLSARGLCNLLSVSSSPLLLDQKFYEGLLEDLSNSLPTSHPNQETALSSLILNFSITLVKNKTNQLEKAIMLATTIVTAILPSISKGESIFRVLTATGNLLSLNIPEVSQFLMSMDLKEIIETQELQKHAEPKIANIAKQICEMLNKSNQQNGDMMLD